MLDFSDGIVEGGLSKVAGSGGIVEDFVVEDGEVEGKSEADGVGGAELGRGNLEGLLVRFKGVLAGSGVVITSRVLSDVSVVVTLHLEEEDLSLGGAGVLDEVVGEQVEDVAAVKVELSLDFLLLGDEQVKVSGSLGLLLLLDGGDGSPGGSARANSVLVGDGEKVAFLDGKLLTRLDDLLHGFEHILESLGLLGNLGEVDVFFTGSHRNECVEE